MILIIGGFIATTTLTYLTYRLSRKSPKLSTILDKFMGLLSWVEDFAILGLLGFLFFKYSNGEVLKWVR